ncbi:MAG TPA: acireductone synthase, partial [Blastocatellia bacterium]|nr:acireductone synthase [Blastocatellia bacterium]
MAPTIILLDIEGTTTPVSFVYEVLFPFARERARGFLLEHWHRSEPDHDIRADLARLTEENRQDRNTGFNPPALSEDSREKTGYIESVVAYVHWLMDQDRKSTGLKSLQGKIWDEGYRSGLLVGEVFDDVPRAFERWQRRGKRICIFSSGSVFAQQL